MKYTVASVVLFAVTLFAAGACRAQDVRTSQMRAAVVHGVAADLVERGDDEKEVIGPIARRQGVGSDLRLRPSTRIDRSRLDVHESVDPPDVRADRVSPGKAFVLSLLLPGLGHRYVHDGRWTGWATAFTLSDVTLWAGMAGAEWRRDHLVHNYRTLAASHARAHVDGKDRHFFLNLATFLSSDEYLDTQLRNRNWQRIDYVSDPSFQWEWESEEDFRRFRDMRENAESLQRRRTFIITTLVANRLISGLTAIRAAGRANDRTMEMSLGVPPPGSTVPNVYLTWRW